MIAAALIARFAVLSCAPAGCASPAVPVPAPVLAPGARVSASAEPLVEVEIPRIHVVGHKFAARVEIGASEDCRVATAFIGAAGFQLDGRPLADGDGCTIELSAGDRLVREIDLGELLPGSGAFKLSHVALDAEPVEVVALEPADPRLEYMRLTRDELDDYWVVLDTNRGQIVVEFWPQHAPEHVKNFLDLSGSGFYDGVTFHRVIPGFMLQGGDPTGTGTGNGPRMLAAEFSKEVKHVRGVLSMARTPDPNSASCQFFVMHGAAAHLDGQYSAFGAVVRGLAVVDAIAAVDRDRADRPIQPQIIQRATVVRAPENPERFREQR
jgi:peptidyl-prolyl cis-trans isomerase B (cyclophilin B)